MQLFTFEKVEYSSSRKSYTMLLKNSENNDLIPLLISSNEAQSLSLTNENIKLPRPRSNELIVNLIKKLSGNIKSVIISKYENGIFFSNINLEINQEIINLDCKPCDAIEIAIRQNIPIFFFSCIIKI